MLGIELVLGDLQAWSLWLGRLGTWHRPSRHPAHGVRPSVPGAVVIVQRDRHHGAGTGSSSITSLRGRR